jgi:DNA-3-methyladenine glycosylase
MTNGRPLGVRPLSRDFYARDTVLVAQQLLGAYLVREISGELLAGRIIEVEAYLGFADEASHSFKGKTKRTAVLFEEAGHTYVYSIHRYHCMDIVTEASGTPGSVLIRAIQPVAGLETMLRLRGKATPVGLTGGPGRLCQALEITRADNGIDVTLPDSPIRILPGKPVDGILATPRVGISKATDKLLRFLVR